MFSISPLVADALKNRRPVVGLESTVIAHGLPAPHNLETARACEMAVRESGAVPATIGIVAGRVVIGLSEEQVAEIAARNDVAKVNPANLAQIIVEERWGATTVASSLHCARLAGIRVFATGGIGGVHRGASESFDISADLNALARIPVIAVCSGAKAILDLPKTLEVLETLGVPIVGYQTDALPAFYSHSSGLNLDLRADHPEQVVELAKAHWQMGFSTSVLVVVPVPFEDDVPKDEIEDVIEEALGAAAELGISGKAVTPFLLSRVAERTKGRAMQANIALLCQNARIAGKIATILAKQE
jgi:pseudouridine-5'-phosphate glycosidase